MTTGRETGTDKVLPSAHQPAVICRLTIENFRGIRRLQWKPVPGMNLILGGGDVGKTTILEAIGLLLSPTNNVVLSESDYYKRDYESEFLIQAVLRLPHNSDIGHQRAFAWPWELKDGDAIMPSADADSTKREACYCVQARGTPELDVTWEVVQPDGTTVSLSQTVRRNIGVIRMSGEDRNDRDLRLVYGSALDRLLADDGLRARIQQVVASFDLNEKLGVEGRAALAELDATLARESLPSGLSLGLTSAQGISIGALVGLLATKWPGIALPMASWGTGTRRMATLQISSATSSQSRITVVDEIERGLEPYRLRKFVGALQSAPTQSFVTTHSAVTISAVEDAQLWYLDSKGVIGAIPYRKASAQQRRDPETFLARLTIVAEGPTEKGFLTYLLNKVIDGVSRDHGLRVTDGQGTTAVLDLLEALAEGGLTFGGFVDWESKYPERWRVVSERMGDMLFRWSSGSTESEIAALVPDDKLIAFMTSGDAEIDFERRRTLAVRLGIDKCDIESIRAATQDFRKLIIDAATGSKEGCPYPDQEKTWKKHERRWFKSELGGAELAQKMLELGPWASLKPKMEKFFTAVRLALGQQGAVPELA